MLYFSYGSNMSVRRLQSRVSSARFTTTASLHKYDLRFHKKSDDGSGKCDAYATGNSEDIVWGVVFEINESEKSILDKKESLGRGYNEKDVQLITPSGEIIVAFTYYAIRIAQKLKPYSWYLQHVLVGAEENGLPGGYVEKIKRIESINDPVAGRHEREMAIYAKG